MELPFDPADIDVILFDLDGTLVDSDDEDVEKWAKYFARFSKNPENLARWFVMAIETPANAVFTVLDFVGLDTIVIRLLAILQGSTHEMPAVPGIVPMIKELSQHYTLGVVSTRAEATGKAYMTALGLHDYFDVYVGRDTVWRIKPHPQPIQHAAEALGTPPERCLMVGDTTVDVVSGNRAGTWTCAVLCGYGQRRELERVEADFILEGTSDLGPLLLG